jgi:putative membrane protein
MMKPMIAVALTIFAVTSSRAQTAALSPAGAPARVNVATRALDDATIVAIFDAANSWDIETSQLAAKKSANKDVAMFADMMIKDHTAVRKLGRDLVAKLNVAPTPPGKDFALYIDHTDIMKKLNSTTGADFDKAYIDHEVTYHQAVIDAVTKQLLPATQNAEVKDLETKVAPNFVAHLAAAKAAQAKIDK